MIVEICDYKPMMQFDKSKPEGPFSRALDVSRAKKLLDWTPTVDLREGLAKTIEWHSEQQKERPVKTAGADKEGA